MDIPDAKGKTYRERLHFGKETYGLDNDDLNPDKELRYPDCYYDAFYAWQTLAACRRERDAVNLSDIIDYTTLYHVELSESEVEAIIFTDQCFVKYLDSKQD